MYMQSATRTQTSGPTPLVGAMVGLGILPRETELTDATA